MKYDPVDFFNYGKSAFHSSQLLFKTPHNSYGSGILFIHGLELMLKSFIILQTGGHKPPIEHNIIKLFKKCCRLDADNILPRGTGLEKLLKFLEKKFYIDTVKARYPNLHKGITLFPHNSFMIIENAIIMPLETKINNLNQ